MNKVIEILKELFELVRSIAGGLVSVAVPVARATWRGARKAWAFGVEHGGPTAKLVWSYLQPVLKKASVPFVWAGVRIWRAIGPLVKRLGRLLFKWLCALVRFLFGKLSGTPVLNRREKQLLAEQLGDEEMIWLVRTRTKVDVGLWFRKRKVWCCLASGRLILFVHGKIPVVDSIDLDQLKKSRYNHITGELVLAPAEGARIVRLRMPPLDAFELLSQVRSDTDVDSWSISLDEHLDELDRAEESGPVVRNLAGVEDMVKA